MLKVRLRVKELMEEKAKRDGVKITATSIASEIDVSPHTVIDMVENARSVSFTNLAKICKYFDCDISDVLVLEKEAGEAAAA